MKQGLSVFKDAKGRYRWLTISSSAFRDRDGEIVSTKALADDVERADRERDFGPLRWWHVPGLDIGDCDFNMLIGKMLIESGTFRDERIGEILKEAPGEYEVSIGFRHPVTEPDHDKTFHHIRRFERSILPTGRASNPLTIFLVKGDNPMATLKEKTDLLRELLGDDALVNSLLSQATDREKAAVESGLAFKAAKEEKETPAPAEAEAVKDAAADPAAQDEADEEISDADFEALMAELEAEPATEVKARKAAPPKAMPPADRENEDDTDDEDGEDYEEGADEGDGEETGAEEAEPEPPAKGKKLPAFLKKGKEAPEIAPFMGDLPTGQFAELMADALAGALEPYFQQLGEIASTVKELREASATVKEAQAAEQKQAAAAVAAVQTTVKDQADEISKLRKASIEQAKALVETRKRLKELEGSETAAAKGFIASQAEETVVKEGSPLLTQMPKSDPLADFTSFVIGAAAKQ